MTNPMTDVTEATLPQSADYRPLVIVGEGGEVIFAVNFDGSVEGDKANASEAARIFAKSLAAQCAMQAAAQGEDVVEPRAVRDAALNALREAKEGDTLDTIFAYVAQATHAALTTRSRDNG